MFSKAHKNGINAFASASPKPAKADSFVDPLDALRHKAFRPLTPLSQALFCPLRPTPSQMGLAFLALLEFNRGRVPPSGGSLEIGNPLSSQTVLAPLESSPFGGIPRNWKLVEVCSYLCSPKEPVPPSGGSLEIGNFSS